MNKLFSKLYIDRRVLFVSFENKLSSKMFLTTNPMLPKIICWIIIVSKINTILFEILNNKYEIATKVKESINNFFSTNVSKTLCAILAPISPKIIKEAYKYPKKLFENFKLLKISWYNSKLNIKVDVMIADNHVKLRHLFH